jgi:hypothetical protein
VGTAEPLAGATVAVKVTEPGKVEGFADEDTAVVVPTAMAVALRLKVWVVPGTLKELSVSTTELDMVPLAVGTKSTA